MKILTYHILGIAISLFLLPVSYAHAATFLPITGDVASLREEVAGDVYAASKSVVIAAPVQGDIFAAGELVDISGNSSNSIFAAGSNLTITGNAADDVRVAGSIVSVSSNIEHDFFAAGSQVFVSNNADVHGDSFIAGEQVIIAGTLHGNLRVASSKLTIAKGAVIMGDVTTWGAAPTIEDGATVNGDVKTISPTTEEKKEPTNYMVRSFLVTIASSIVFALALLFGAPALVARSKAYITNSPGQSGVTGLVWMFGFVPAFVILLVSTVGIHVGIFIFLATLPLLWLTFGIMTIATGSIAYRLTMKNEGVAWHHCVIGAVLIALVSLLNVVGFIILTLAFLVSFGALLKASWDVMQGK